MFKHCHGGKQLIRKTCFQALAYFFRLANLEIISGYIKLIFLPIGTRKGDDKEEN